MAQLARRNQSTVDAESPRNGSAPERDRVYRMFDRIAHRYDLLNRLLSLGRDVAWRNRLADCLPSRAGLEVLDLATGTADVLLALCRKNDAVALGVGLDMAHKMLKQAQRKITRCNLDDRLSLVKADAADLPFASASFDVVTIAFGVRNFVDISESLRAIRRVLKPNGRLLILEFSLPGNRLLRMLYLFYFRHVLPRVGGAVSRDFHAYRYLNETVETFPYGRKFCDILEEAGFRNVEAQPVTFGVATVYQGTSAG